MVHLQTDARVSRAQSTATFGSDDGRHSARGAGQPARLIREGTPRKDNPAAPSAGGSVPVDASNAGGAIPAPSLIPPFTMPHAYGTTEKSEIVLLNFPSPSQFRTWRTTSKITIASCSTNPDLAFAWICEVERPDATVDSLFDSGNFRTLDAKLSAALGKIVSGDLSRQINIVEETLAKTGKFMKGRQKL